MVSPTTTTPPDCEGLGEHYLDVFFAVGAGTPSDPDATAVELPVAELRAIEHQARDAGCAGFGAVICSAWAELDAQGLTAQVQGPDCPS